MRPLTSGIKIATRTCERNPLCGAGRAVYAAPYDHYRHVVTMVAGIILAGAMFECSTPR